MQVNRNVVQALMSLRQIDVRTLAGLAHVTVAAMSAWVYDGKDEAVPFDQQIEVLSYLGVRGDGPRSDVVHYWHAHENLFSRAKTTYWAVSTLLQAFGPAEVVYISRESDPALTFSAKAHFGLKFKDFLAILAVTSHPLRSISFSPDIHEDLAWAPEAIGVLLPADEFDRLEPGAMQVKGMTQYLTYTAELSHWERLREEAQRRGMRAGDVASLLLGNAAPASARIEQAPVAAVEPEVKSAQPSPAARAATQPTDADLFAVPVKLATA